MSDHTGSDVTGDAAERDIAALRELAAALPGSVRAVVIFGELRARNRRADIAVTVTASEGTYVWEWGEPIDADAARAGYVTAVADRICTVLSVDPQPVDPQRVDPQRRDAPPPGAS